VHLSQHLSRARASAQERLFNILAVRAFNAPLLDRDVDYALQLISSYQQDIARAGRDTSELSILELGPGINLGPALLLVGLGARVAVADRFLVGWDRFYHPRFYRRLRERTRLPTSALDAVIAAGQYGANVVRLHKPVEMLVGPANSASFDLVLSTAVLEHVYDFDKAARALAELTRAGGTHFHQIDFRDHKNFSRPLEFLLFDAASYPAHSSGGRRGNRWRLSECLRAFGENGLHVDDVEKNDLTNDAYLDEFVPRLRASSSPYRAFPREDLQVLGARVRLTRV
jgi:Methyltransferase domain